MNDYKLANEHEFRIQQNKPTDKYTIKDARKREKTKQQRLSIRFTKTKQQNEQIQINYIQIDRIHPLSFPPLSVKILILVHLHSHVAPDLHLPVEILLAVPRVVLISPTGTQLPQLLLVDKMQRF